jgi:DNA (cytosine-5)-methyltransferase 1
MTDLTSIDLFCGAGGITEGFRQAGFHCVLANDFDLRAMQTFKANQDCAEAVCAPVEELDPGKLRRALSLARGEVDCLVGGPPCQGFSINAPQRFLDDPRNSLFKHYIRFVRAFEPKTVLFENVPGMLSLGKGAVVRGVVKALEALGYQVTYRILFGAHYGVPQERWRLIIIGSRLGIPIEHPRPTHAATGRANFTGARSLTFGPGDYSHHDLKHHVSVEQAIGDLPVLAVGQGSEESDYNSPPNSDYSTEMRYGSTRLYNHVAAKISPVNLKRLEYIRPGGSWRDLPINLLPLGMQRARQSDHTKRYGRPRPDGLAGTVMTKMDPHWGAAFHYSQARTLTVREAARLQSFPDRYKFAGSRVSQYAQVGNAVPVKLAYAVALQFVGALQRAASEGIARMAEVG